ncbi:MAG: tRNA uridine-5-carboxymethylaminomethyl(34) synthesis GTPase MnmE [Xanthomonadales bacterium]|nr:tRNA uridine-5-carboxymethylaminomethyl(34) synthesis GTPase MnmE [Xanthomonadales bacterium]MBK7143922.1 tRNA uridine-5-carboxymethylaminomethyl(34) synthesis GTPase MnmE [Xanthomonadales bacterium]MCC6560060.1 tRNA uridine-5-carboxymethylaminomethyl(34) synthesis GTPase MnmE [Xanthomonadales bacterium]
MTPRATIAAIATAPGAGGIGIVRLSGAEARQIAQTLCALELQPRHAHYAKLHDAGNALIDSGVVLWFPGPHSFTGEDVVELQIHGAPVVLARLLARCIELGARHARAGEFSERAFLNGKIDLAQAEAIADLIAARSEAQARAAQRSLQGEFSRRVQSLLQALIDARLHVEAAIDFPEEEIDFLGDGQILAKLDALQSSLTLLLREAERGQRLRDGLHAVLIGAPNAGKSSLLNALAGEDRAIVTEIAGTTRDLLREAVNIDGIDITLVDTAGLRDAGDAIESEGMRRARSELARADLAIVVLAPEDETQIDALLAEVPAGAAVLVVHNKSDLADRSAVVHGGALEHLHLSATRGSGIDSLRARIRAHAGGDGSDGSFSARARHVAALQRVRDALANARARLVHERAGELVAEELRFAQQALSEITGAFSSDDLLGAIFAGFCIGK